MAVFFKQNGFKFWAKFLERFGTPIFLGKCKDTETEDMSRALLDAHAQSVLSIDAEDDVQILSTAGTSGTAGAAFESFNNQFDSSDSKGCTRADALQVAQMVQAAVH